MKKNKVFKNTIMLFIFNIAKIVFPFLTLPYLTRIFSTDTYGTVAYIKTVMNYMQIIVDFGFVLSATKDIVKIKDNKEELGLVVGDTMLARIVMGLVGFAILIVLIIILPILKNNIIYTVLSYVVVFETIFLMDFLFRGIERMHIITIRFVLMKIVSTFLTFILVKNDSDMMLIPILDIISSFLAILLVFYEIHKLKIKIKFSNLKNALKSLKSSFIYFLSNVASTSFNALSTLIIGVKISSTEVAYWSVCMQVIGSIQACYSPISDGIYPEMIRTKNWNLIKKIIKIMLPLIMIGCVMCFYLSGFILNVLGGKEYLVAIPIFRLLIPSLLFSFFSYIFGWPALGSIGKMKEVTLSTIMSILINILFLILLIFTDSFTLINIAIVRSAVEFILCSLRFYFCKKNKKLFAT